MNGKSLDMKEDLIKKLRTIAPQVFNEDKIDWEKLKSTFGDDINFADERYVLNWAGKSDAFRAIQTQTTATLIPDKDESVKFDDTNNIFIEGENLEVLKVLQKAYYSKIKMIYIDPPYNTGNDFIYNDKFAEKKNEYLKRSGEKDEEGLLTNENLYRKNSKESGHYHSNWLTMMYPRLFLARNLLRDDGVIFVSIDDNEVHNLRMVMNEIFGEENFVAEFPRLTKKAGKTTELIAKNNDYILCFKKSDLTFFYQEKHSDEGYRHSDDYLNERGKYKLSQTLDYSSIQYSPSLDYEILINGVSYIPGNVSKKEMKDRQMRNPNSDFFWRWSKKLFEFGLQNGFIVVKGKRIYTKTYQNAQINKNDNGYFIETKERTKALSSIEFIQNKYSNDNSRKDISKVFKEKIFEYSKPVSLIKYLVKTTANDDDIILDFFAGSCTTAHAVLDLNKEDASTSSAQVHGNRKFIMVQLPEKCEENSEAYIAGFETIADIGKERIRRVIKKIQSEPRIDTKNHEKEQPEIFRNDDKISDNLSKFVVSKQDLGFKVFKLQESNFKIWRGDKFTTGEELEKQLETFVNPVKEGSTEENMLYELLLKTGIDLNCKIEKIPLSLVAPERCKGGRGVDSDLSEDGVCYYLINENELVIALSKINEDIVKNIIKTRPLKVITLDKLFERNDQLKTNTILQMKDAGIEFKVV